MGVILACLPNQTITPTHKSPLHTSSFTQEAVIMSNLKYWPYSGCGHIGVYHLDGAKCIHHEMNIIQAILAV
jgi:hypothetical protein